MAYLHVVVTGTVARHRLGQVAIGAACPFTSRAASGPSRDSVSTMRREWISRHRSAGIQMYDCAARCDAVEWIASWISRAVLARPKQIAAACGGFCGLPRRS